MFAPGDKWFGMLAMEGHIALNIYNWVNETVRTRLGNNTYLIHTFGSSECQDAKPEQGKDDSADDAEIAEPEAE